MHHPMAVCEVEGRCKRARESRCVGRRNSLFARHPLPEGFALDVRHDVEENTSRLPGIVYRHDMRMSEARYGLDLLEKPLGSQRGCNVRIENLYCNAPVMPRIARTIYGRHSAAADLVLDRVSVAERMV